MHKILLQRQRRRPRSRFRLPSEARMGGSRWRRRRKIRRLRSCRLQKEVSDAFNVSQKKKSKSQAWMGESEVRDVCQHRYVLEAARACQRNEEATAVAVDAARLELQSTLREYDLQTAIKVRNVVIKRYPND